MLVNNTVANKLNILVNSPPNALLIEGPIGSGKTYLAMNIAAKLLNISISEAAINPNILLISKNTDKKFILLEQVQEIIKFLSLKTTGIGIIRRVVIIENSQYINVEGQNKLLKTLEEPPKDTLIILTVDSSVKLLKTVVSRCRRFTTAPVELDEAIQYLEPNYTKEQINKAWQVSKGLPGLLLAILIDGQSHLFLEAIADAKLFISASSYDRLKLLDQYQKDLSKFTLLCSAMTLILSTASGLNKQNSSSKKLVKSRIQLLKSQLLINNNVNTRLTLTELMINL